MRGAAESVAGFQTIKIKPGNVDFEVSYDASTTSEDELMTAIEAAGEKVHPTE